VVSVPRQDPVVVGAQPAITTAVAKGTRPALWWLAGSVIAFAALGVGALVLGRRRRRLVASGDG
jgi:hypothetical protein